MNFWRTNLSSTLLPVAIGSYMFSPSILQSIKISLHSFLSKACLAIPPRPTFVMFCYFDSYSLILSCTSSLSLGSNWFRLILITLIKNNDDCLDIIWCIIAYSFIVASLFLLENIWLTNPSYFKLFEMFRIVFINNSLIVICFK